MVIPERVQGTDGIRREVALASDPRVRGLTALEALLERDLLTDDFFELYAYAFARDLLALGRARLGAPVVIGWDGRDRDGVFVGAAIRGIARAGARPHLIGMLPTPAVPVVMAAAGAVGGLMITASHNPANQNGLKSFYPPLGLKPLPADDARLTRRLFETAAARIHAHGPGPEPVAAQQKARDQFLSPLLADLAGARAALERIDLAVIVDAANGALSGLAAEAARRAGIRWVDQVNADPSAGINRGGGAADLEGVIEVAPEALGSTGRFRDHAGLAALLELGRARRGRRGRSSWTAAAIFDGDGDRLHLALYDPWRDRLRVLSGDEVTALQALALGRGARRVYAATIESDLAALELARRRGFRPLLTAVGDKWLLQEAARCELRALARRAPPAARRRLLALARRRQFSAADLLRLAPSAGSSSAANGFAIGGEATGHTVRPLVVRGPAGSTQRIYAGNALLAALHALRVIARSAPSPATLERLHDPCGRGALGSAYVYYARKRALRPGDRERPRLIRELRAAAEAELPAAGRFRLRRFVQEPELVFLESRPARHRATVFLRNSGTEDKAGVHARASRRWAGRIERLIEGLAVWLQLRLKDPSKEKARRMLELLRRARYGQLHGLRAGADAELLAVAEGKEGLLRRQSSGYRLTSRGAQVLALLESDRRWRADQGGER